MSPLLYVETSVVSYLTARPSEHVVAAARQLHTQVWWARERTRYALFISPLVLEEARRGDPTAAAARLEAIEGLPAVEVTEEAVRLARRLLEEVPLPPKATTDALHIAVAATAGARYLLTWNFRHIPNPTLRERIARTCRSEGYTPPELCSPEELLAGLSP